MPLYTGLENKLNKQEKKINQFQILHMEETCCLYDTTTLNGPPGCLIMASVFSAGKLYCAKCKSGRLLGAQSASRTGRVALSIDAPRVTAPALMVGVVTRAITEVLENEDSSDSTYAPSHESTPSDNSSFGNDSDLASDPDELGGREGGDVKAGRDDGP